MKARRRYRGAGVNLATINADGAFSVSLDSGTVYKFATVTQPNTPAQTCNVINPTGTVAGADITDVIVACGRFLIVGAPSTPSWNTDVQTTLKASGLAVVDIFDASAGTPTLATLQGYSAALVYSDKPFADPAALGNVVADYFDAGGVVVMATFANASLPISGRWQTGNYHLIAPTGQKEPNDQGNISIGDPASPLVSGVVSLKGAGFLSKHRRRHQRRRSWSRSGRSVARSS